MGSRKSTPLISLRFTSSSDISSTNYIQMDERYLPGRAGGKLN